MTIYHLPENCELHLTEGNGTYMLRLYDADAEQYYPSMKGYSGPNAYTLVMADIERITKQTQN